MKKINLDSLNKKHKKAANSYNKKKKLLENRTKITKGNE